ncbi:MAG: HAMP domain-containing protein, partial [Desulfamplus sp.]|nr:HAMP domain-containing protein [Desulfamplus sp.]
RFHDNFIVLSEYLARNAELGVLLKNSAMLENLTTNMLQQEDIIKVVIKDAEGKTITGTDRISMLESQQNMNESGLEDSQKQTRSEKQTGSETQIGSEIQTGSEKETDFEDMLDSSIKIETKIFQIQPDSGDMVMYGVNTSREIIGYVELYYTPSGLKALTMEMTFLFIVISLVLSFISMAWYWFFARSITSPLINLVAVSRKVSQGNLEVRASGGDLRETKTLAKVFNEMLNSVKAHQKEMEKVHIEMAKQKSLAEIGKFSTMVAHELKNPIAIIKGSMDILKKKNLDQKTRETMLFYIDDEIQRLNRLVDEFLLFAKPKNPVLSRISMSLFIGEITEKFRFTVPEKKIKLSLNVEDAPVECDGILMERALLNILKNAVENSIGTDKRDQAQNLIEYDADIEVYGRLESTYYIIEIKDRGKGVDKTIMDEIFNPFFTTRAKGTGLGLAIVRDIVAVHKGTVSVKNRLSGGASFEIKIIANVVPSFFLKKY